MISSSVYGCKVFKKRYFLPQFSPFPKPASVVFLYISCHCKL